MTAWQAKFMLIGIGHSVLPAWRDGEMGALLLVLFLGMALGMCLIGLLLVLYFLRSGRYRNCFPAPHRREPIPLQPAVHPHMRAFSRWVAIRDVEPETIQKALGLHNPVRCSWEAGLSGLQGRKFFITPPIGDWVLVFGARLPDPAEDVDLCFRFLTELSRHCGEVQFFSANRLLQHHAWAWLRHGQVVRAYAWAGRTLWNQGTPTRQENELRFRCFAYAEPAQRGARGEPDSLTANCEKVHPLAALWSVNPATLDGRWLSEAEGIAGELAPSRTH
jgi:hypothetical protein